MQETAVLRDIKKKFSGRTVLDGVDFSINSGQIFGLIGPDGSGKSTILRILAGVYRADSGTAAALGFDVKSQIHLIRPRMGYMSQTYGLYADLTVEENLDFFGDIFGVPPQTRATRKNEILDFSRLEKFKRRPAGQLSGGMYKKLALGCTLIHQPDLLLLDEPTAGVDPVSRQEFWKIIMKIKFRTTILVTTHYMEEAQRCDQVALLYQGKIVEKDTPEGLLKKFPRKIWVVPCDKAFEVFSSLGRFPEIAEANLFGDRVHFVLNNPAELNVISDKISRLAGVRGQVEPVSPTLEDLFVLLIKEH